MSNNPTPREGERWRVTIEGIVESETAGLIEFYFGGGGNVWLNVEEGTWERLLDPELEWAPGDLVLAADGEVWVRASNAKPWYRPHDPEWFADEQYPARPLRRLVPESS